MIYKNRERIVFNRNSFDIIGFGAMRYYAKKTKQNERKVSTQICRQE